MPPIQIHLSAASLFCTFICLQQRFSQARILLLALSALLALLAPLAPLARRPVLYSDAFSAATEYRLPKATITPSAPATSRARDTASAASFASYGRTHAEQPSRS